MLLSITLSLLLSVVVQSLDKGPVGLNFYRQLDRLPELYTGVRTRQFSSFDRKGGNNDGFEGTYSCIRKVQNKCVIAEWLGPGEIDSVWFTRLPDGNGRATGNIRIELDGKAVVNRNLEEVVTGQLGSPFVWPLVGNFRDTVGGCVIKVPMQFTKSMRIVTDHNPFFYHVTFRTFANADGVQTFNMSFKSVDVIDVNRRFGLDGPLPMTRATVETKKLKNVAVPKKSGRKLVTLEGSGQIRQLMFRWPRVARSPRVYDDGRAFAKGGRSQFVVKIDPRNDGVRITRRFDPEVAHQRAQLLVDDVFVGDWTSGPAVKAGPWAEASIDVPARITKNKTRINVKNVFVSAAMDFNEFRYNIYSIVNGEQFLTDVMDVGPDHPGLEAAHQYQIVGQKWAGQRRFRYNLPGKSVANSKAVLGQTRLKITFDSKTTVDVPFDEFFGSGLGMFNNRALFFAVDAVNGKFTSWWPMPFKNNATIELINNSGIDAGDIEVEVQFEKDEKFKKRLDAGEFGYFRATYNRGHTVVGRDWIFLNAKGHGVFHGVTQTMRGLIKWTKDPEKVRNYLEGDERVYTDGLRTPQLYGTGTEDFYESGWYFRGTYHMPLAGNPAHEIAGFNDGCPIDCTVGVRLFAGDGIHFMDSITFGIEHGPTNNEPGDYSSVAYWYGQDQPIIKRTDAIQLDNAKSRTDHGYSAGTETKYNLDSVYEGQHDKVKVKGQMTVAKGEVKFNLNVDRGNNGVRIYRTSDQNVQYQCVRVLVDGKFVGFWLQPLGNIWQRWMMDSFDIPAVHSKNKTKLAISLQPVAHSGGPVHWAASRYEAISIMK